MSAWLGQTVAHMGRSPTEVRLPSCETGEEELFIDALFGRVPRTGPLKFICRGFEEAFDPVSVKQLFGHPPRALTRELKW